MKFLWRRPEALAGLVLVLAACLMGLFAPLIAPYDPLAVDLGRKLLPPSAQHWMGTDQTGRDIFSRIVWGARPSLTVGILAVTIGALGGIAIGLTAGYVRGFWEQVSMRAMDGLAPIPMLSWPIGVVGIVGVGPVQIGSWSLPNETKVILLVGLLY